MARKLDIRNAVHVCAQRYRQHEQDKREKQEFDLSLIHISEPTRH